jgi:cell division protein FtsB
MPSVAAIEYLSGWLGLTLLFATVAVSLYLVQISTMANAGYELQRLETERDAWLARNEQLEYELAKRRSLAWVEAQATERLGLVRSDRPAPVIRVNAPSSNQDDAAGASQSMGATSGSKASAMDRTDSGRPRPGDPSVAMEALGAWLASWGGR